MINVFNTTTKMFLILQRNTLFNCNNVYSTFLIITGIKAIYTELSCSPFERRFKALTSRSCHALNRIIVRLWWAHLGKVALILCSRRAQKFEIFSLKNSAITIRSWGTKSPIFPISAKLFPIWCAHQFSWCLSVTWARREGNVSAKIVMSQIYWQILIKVNSLLR